MPFLTESTFSMIGTLRFQTNLFCASAFCPEKKAAAGISIPAKARFLILLCEFLIQGD